MTGFPGLLHVLCSVMECKESLTKHCFVIAYFPVDAGAGESGKSTFVKQMK